MFTTTHRQAGRQAHGTHKVGMAGMCSPSKARWHCTARHRHSSCRHSSTTHALGYNGTGTTYLYSLQGGTCTPSHHHKAGNGWQAQQAGILHTPGMAVAQWHWHNKTNSHSHRPHTGTGTVMAQETNVPIIWAWWYMVAGGLGSLAHHYPSHYGIWLAGWVVGCMQHSNMAYTGNKHGNLRMA